MLYAQMSEFLQDELMVHQHPEQETLFLEPGSPPSFLKSLFSPPCPSEQHNPYYDL